MHSIPQTYRIAGYTAVWMSGQNEASFLIQDSRQAQRLRNGVVAKRVERLYRVQIALSARSAAAGSQDQGEWVTLTANGSSENTEKAKVRQEASKNRRVHVSCTCTIRQHVHVRVCTYMYVFVAYFHCSTTDYQGVPQL